MADLFTNERLLFFILCFFMFVLGCFYPFPDKHSDAVGESLTVPPCADMYPDDVSAYRACMTAFAMQHNWYPSPISGDQAEIDFCKIVVELDIDPGSDGKCLFSYPTWNGFDGFWQDGAAIETLANLMKYGNNTMFKSVVTSSVRDVYSLLEAYGPQPSYDDMGWYAISYIRVHEILGEAEDDPSSAYGFLGEAQNIYHWIWTNGWDKNETCHGGIWFDQTLAGKQTVENAQMLFLGSKLYRLTKNESLIDSINRTWNFIERNEIINMTTYRVADGIKINESCGNNGVYGPSYNEGLMMSALVESGQVFNRTREFVYLANKIAHAAIQNLTRNGTLTEYCSPKCDDDAKLFKGIFLRNLRYLMDFMERNDEYYNTTILEYYAEYIRNNSNIVWNSNRCDPDVNKCEVVFKDGPSMRNGTVGPVFDVEFLGPYINSTPISQTPVLDLFIAGISSNTTCKGSGCDFDPPIPPPKQLTCDDHPCPQRQPCCTYQGYYTCCESTQKCVFGYCI